jgi:hypothetical protein
MIEAMKTFLLTIKQQEHVVPLLKHLNLRVNLVCEQQTLQLVIKEREILLLHDEEKTKTTSEIQGNQTAFIQLLEGKERLRVLERNGQITVSAPLRIVLLLESIFYLTKTQDDFLKITNF